MCTHTYNCPRKAAKLAGARRAVRECNIILYIMIYFYVSMYNHIYIYIYIVVFMYVCIYLYGEVLLRGAGTLRYLFPPSASAQWQPDDLAIPTKKWFLGAGFLGAPPISRGRLRNCAK